MILKDFTRKDLFASSLDVFQQNKLSYLLNAQKPLSSA